MKNLDIKEPPFEIKEMGDDLLDHVVLRDELYDGVELQYGEVKLIEENDALRVSFIFEVFDNPNNVDTKSKKFIDYIGSILTQVLEEELIRSRFKRQKKAT